MPQALLPSLDERLERRVRYETERVPALRAVGMALLLLVGFSLLEPSRSGALSLMLTVVASYVALSWVALKAFFKPREGLDLAFVFLTADVFVWGLVVFLTGGNQSWLFPVLLIRAADQSNTRAPRVGWFTGVAVFVYAAILAYLGFVEHRELVPSVEAVKLFFLAGCGVYLSLTSRTATSLRSKARDAMRTSQELIGRLQAQAVELEEARRTAEGATAVKSIFLATMSHEIRTPLNGVIGMLQLAQSTPLSPEQREYVDTARESADNLLVLLNDILDLSKIEAGKLRLENIGFGVRDVLHKALRTLNARAQEKRLTLNLNVPNDLPERVMGDPTRVRQVILNLVGNALKFTSEGGVTVSVAMLEKSDTSATLQFSVTDTGIGIAKDQQTQVFKAFNQASSSDTRRFGGTGLGLNICGQLVEMFQGRIWVESQLGRGSTFHFTAKLGLDAAAAVAPVVELPSLKGVRALVISSSDDGRQRLADMLESWGVAPVKVECNDSARWALLRASNTAKPYRLVVHDEQPGETDALSLLRDLNDSNEVPSLAVVVISTHPLPAEYRVAAGRFDVSRVAKPVLASSLLESIQSVVKPVGTKPVESVLTDEATAPALRAPVRISPVPAAAKLAPTGPSLNILVADDNPVNRTIASRLLEKVGHKVTTVENGKAAVEAAAANRYDVVLMDVQMPVMGGLEATRRIRTVDSASGRGVPIIAITAQAMVEDQQRCLDAGADGYVSKPIDAEKLYQTINRIHEAKQVRVEGERAAVGAMSLKTA